MSDFAIIIIALTILWSIYTLVTVVKLERLEEKIDEMRNERDADGSIN